MSGSFHAGKTALELGVPLRVAEPSVFRKEPAGNARLLELGGKSFHPKTDIRNLLEDAGIRSPLMAFPDGSARQLSLFDG